MSSLNFLTDTHLAVQKQRVAAQVRQTHLKRNDSYDPDTEWVIVDLTSLEEKVEKCMAEIIGQHPAWPWLKGIKGIGYENVAKVIGYIDKWGIENIPNISKLWKLSGYAVENGHAPKRIKGQKITYYAELRMLLWRLASSLLRARGVYYDCYCDYKAKLQERFAKEGRAIVPASELPKDEKKKRYEDENTISEGHVHYMALRKMIKLFIANLWLVWREAEGLPVTNPYAIDMMGHSNFIDPWSLVDKKPKGS